MPSGLTSVGDRAPVRGMNTYDDVKTLSEGECQLLVNAKPANPAIPRRGCTGVNLDLASAESPLAPWGTLKGYGATDLFAGWTLNTGYTLRGIPRNTSSATVNLAAATFAANDAWFGSLAAHDALYLSTNKDMASWKAQSNAATLRHKILESNGTTTITREMCINVAVPLLGIASVADPDPGTGKTWSIDYTTGICTSAAHGFRTCDKVRLTTAGTLPTGLSAGVDYYLNVIGPNTFYICSSFANALSATAVTCTDNGTGAHTATSQWPSGNAWLLAGSHVSYAFTYVRHTHADAFAKGTTPSNMILPVSLGSSGYQPRRHTDSSNADVHQVPQLESIEEPQNRTVANHSGAACVVRITLDTASHLHLSAILAGATHIRVYRTLQQPTHDDADGATHYFVCDLPILDPGASDYWYDQNSEATIEGNSDYFLTACNYTGAPLASFVESVRNRLWLYEDGVGYYSETPGGDGGCVLSDAQATPQKWFSWFKPDEYRVECDPSDNIPSTGLCRNGNDLYFFKESKIWILPSGDPTVAVPILVSDTVGCPWPFTITKANVPGVFGECILFLSNKGPAVITSGGNLRILSEFKIAELWPEKSTELWSLLTGTAANKTSAQYKCIAWYWDNTWFVRYDNLSGTRKTYCYTWSPEVARDRDAPCGSWQFVHGKTGAGVEIFHPVLAMVTSEGACYCVSLPDGTTLTKLQLESFCANASTYADVGGASPVSYQYYEEVKGRPMVPGPMEMSFSELFMAMLLAEWRDTESFVVTAVSDKYRFSEQASVGDSATAVTQIPAVGQPYFRHGVAIIPKQGFFGSFFWLHVQKKIPTSGDFKYFGVDFDFLPRPSAYGEFFVGGVTITYGW